MKILFLYKYANYEPLGLMILSAELKKAGHMCAFVDVKLEKNFIKTVVDLSPDIIAYSVFTGSHNYYKRINLKLKKHCSFLSVFGGPHCTFFPDFIYEEGVDIICRGEADQSIVLLAEAMEQKHNYCSIPNLWVKKQGEIFKNQMDDLCVNLDSISFPDRNLVNVYSHYRSMKRRDVITSRGCPYNCTYCFNHAGKALYKSKGRYVRQRSVDNVIEELVILKDKYGSRKFHFQDDVFTVNRNWTFEFCNAYKQQVQLPFEVQLRVNLVDEEIVKALKEAGCVLAMYGIESGNDAIRNEVLNRKISHSKIVETAAIFRRYGIRTMSVNMLGLPDESFENALETLRLNIDCKPSYAWNSLYHPYPMTKLAAYSIEKGYFDGDIHSFNESFLFSRSVMKTPDIRRIENLHFLFPIAVDFPACLGIVKWATKLRLTGFYKFLFFLHRVFAAVVSLRRITMSEIFVYEKSRFFAVEKQWQKL